MGMFFFFFRISGGKNKSCSTIRITRITATDTRSLEPRATRILNISQSFFKSHQTGQTHNINGEKTKVITTVEEVWKCDLNYQKFGLRNYIEHSKQC